ncbi:hypothetical protein QCA50_001974 [Cerrena zonata]|uniref:Uncharacterized protein n=1 Tax=Cerrena zonata TaxID=2478898 RepID=A0AAW0GY78_9APHY
MMQHYHGGHLHHYSPSSSSTTTIANHGDAHRSVQFAQTAPFSYQLVPQPNPTFASPQVIQPQFQLGHTVNVPASGLYGVPSQWPTMSTFPAPVGSNPTDEFILLTTLRACTNVRGRGSSDYKTVLESLHGVNSHTADDWKNYFLQHMERLTSALGHSEPPPTCVPKVESSVRVREEGCSRPAEQKDKQEVVRRKSFDVGLTIQEALRKNDGHKHTEPAARSAPTRFPNPPSHDRRARTPPDDDAPRSDSSVTRFNSDRKRHQDDLSSNRHARARSPRSPRKVHVLVKRRKNLHSSERAHRGLDNIEIPSTPSRSPTPPTLVERCGRSKVKYTEEDLTYFVKYIQWKLKDEPGIFTNEICRQLSENAPHHSLCSWSSFYRRNEHTINRIKARNRRQYTSTRLDNVNDDDLEDGSSSDCSDGNFASDTDSEIIAIAEEGSLEDDEFVLGGSGDPIGSPEMRTMARYIERQAEWDGTSSTKRICWTRFYEQYTQRTTSSWKQMYKRHRLAIDSLARKYRRKTDKTKDTTTVSKQEVEETSMFRNALRTMIGEDYKETREDD